MSCCRVPTFSFCFLSSAGRHVKATADSLPCSAARDLSIPNTDFFSDSHLLFSRQDTSNNPHLPGGSIIWEEAQLSHSLILSNLIFMVSINGNILKPLHLTLLFLFYHHIFMQWSALCIYIFLLWSLCSFFLPSAASQSEHQLFTDRTSGHIWGHKSLQLLKLWF